MNRSQVRPLRLSVGLTQAELAERAEVHRSTVSDLENDKVPERIAHALYEAAFGRSPATEEPS